MKDKPVPSRFDSWIPQPPEVGTDIEIEESPPIQRMTHSKSRMSDSIIYETRRVRRAGGPESLRDRGAAPTSPPGGVL